MRDNPSKQRSFLKIVEVYKCHKAIHAQVDLIPASNARHPSPSIELNFAQKRRDSAWLKRIQIRAETREKGTN